MLDAEEPRRRFAVEAQPRSRDLPPDRWPVVVRPQPDELLSSFMHRIAFANGLPARYFGEALGSGAGLWSPSTTKLDVRLVCEKYGECMAAGEADA